MVGIRLLDLDDMAKAAFRARVGGVGVALLALGVVGQQDIGRAIAARLRVFGAVHRGGAQQVGGKAGVDHHVALVVKAVLGGQRPGAMHQRQPVDRAVLFEPRDIERAIVQQIAIGRRIIGDGPGRDVFVLIIKAVVVAHIDHELAVFADRGLGALMAETAQSGAFDGG